jgi:uncharacterized membrane protein YphA (DoxX/SURF4 family)
MFPMAAALEHQGIFALRLLLAALWLVAGISKLARWERRCRWMEGYGAVPRPLACALGSLLPIVECALGLLLLLGIRQQQAALASGVLLLAFGALVGHRLARGERFSCFCFGAAAHPATWGAVGRNAVLAAGSGVVAISPSTWAALLPAPGMEVAAGALPPAHEAVPVALLVAGLILAGSAVAGLAEIFRRATAAGSNSPYHDLPEVQYLTARAGRGEGVPAAARGGRS